MMPMKYSSDSSRDITPNRHLFWEVVSVSLRKGKIREFRVSRISRVSRVSRKMRGEEIMGREGMMTKTRSARRREMNVPVFCVVL